MDRVLTIRLRLPEGTDLHARPAAVFAETARRFRSAIEVAYAGRQGSAKSVIAVLGLGARRGSEVTIQACGEDAEQALAALRRLVEADFRTA